MCVYLQIHDQIGLLVGRSPSGHLRGESFGVGYNGIVIPWFPRTRATRTSALLLPPRYNEYVDKFVYCPRAARGGNITVIRV